MSCSIRSSFRATRPTPRAIFSRTKRNSVSRLICFITYSIGAIVLARRALRHPQRQSIIDLALARRIVSLGLCDVVAALRRSIRSARCDCWVTRVTCKLFEPDRLQALAQRDNRLQAFDDYYVGLPFFGLAATVCAWLWLKSNYIPRGLSIFGVIASAWCVLLRCCLPDLSRLQQDR